MLMELSSKLGMHADDDIKVPIVISAPFLTPGSVTDAVNTTQVAPTILKLLGLDASQLQVCASPQITF
jgi:arylsulfatase A-like enzyme